MTTLNTIIEEEKKEFDELYGWVKPLTLRLGMWSFTTTAIQRAYEAGRADWLRSEIEKLEGMKRTEHQDWCRQTAPLEFASCGCWKDWNYALTSIITQYTEELLELEKGV